MKLSNKDFKQLVSGNTKIFEALYAKCKTRIFTYLLTKTNGNRYIAEEVFSETFCCAIQSVHSLKRNDNLLAWLYSIAHKKYIDYIRELYRDEKIKKASLEKSCYAPDSLKDIIEEEKIAALEVALTAIKEKYKNILVLKYLEGKTQKEIAVLLNKSESAVESLLTRARSHLRRELQKSSEIFEEE